MQNERKVALLTQTETIAFEQRPMPAVGTDDVLLRVKVVGVCGSDVAYFKTGRTGVGSIKFPFILGHECAGVVEAVGERVTQLRPGDRVCVEPGYACGHCEMCTTGRYNLCTNMSFMGSAVAHAYGEGALVEYSVRPAQLCFRLPENVSFELGAMAEPLSVGLHAARRARLTAGDSAVIMGCGPIGACVLLALHAMGVHDVTMTDVIPARLEKMRAMGAQVRNVAGLDEAALRDCIAQSSADAVIDTTCVEIAMNASLHWLKKGGCFVQLGVPGACRSIDLQTLFNKGIDLVPSFRYANTYPAVLSLLAAGKLPAQSLITHRFDFEDAQKAFALAVSRDADVMKVIITI